MSDKKKLKMHKENAPVKNVNMDVLECCYPPIIQVRVSYYYASCAIHMLMLIWCAEWWGVRFEAFGIQ